MLKKIIYLIAIINIGNATYAQCSNTYSSITEAVCGSYISPSGNYTYYTSNTYTDTIPNLAGCDSIITINLIVSELPVISFVSNFTIGCVPSTINFINTSNSINLSVSEWRFGDGNEIIVAGGSPVLNTYNQIGIYNIFLKVTTVDGCVDSLITNQFIYIDDCASISEQVFENTVFYPNPVSNIISLKNIPLNTVVVLSNIYGQILYKTTNTNNEFSINLDSFPSGMYSIQLENGTNTLHERIIKL